VKNQGIDPTQSDAEKRNPDELTYRKARLPHRVIG
jgi:hypothetical protein